MKWWIGVGTVRRPRRVQDVELTAELPRGETGRFENRRLSSLDAVSPFWIP